MSDRYLRIGFDPGTRNWGTGIFDPRTNITRMELVDLEVDVSKDGQMYKVKYEEKHNEERMRRLVDHYHPFLVHTKYVGIEKQMKRKFIVLVCILVAILNERYGKDGLIVLITSPRTMRSLFGISADGKYAAGKKMSKHLIQQFMSSESFSKCAVRFQKVVFDKKGKSKKEHKVDAYEALIIALGLHFFTDHLLKLHYSEMKREKKIVSKGLIPVRAINIQLRLPSTMTKAPMIHKTSKKRKDKKISSPRKKAKISSDSSKKRKCIDLT